PRTLAQEGEPRCASRFLPTGNPRADGRSSRASGLSWSARGRLATPPPLPRRRPSPGRRLRWPSTACASLGRHALTWADDESIVGTAGDHAGPSHPRRRPPRPPRRPPTLTPAG